MIPHDPSISLPLSCVPGLRAVGFKVTGRRRNNPGTVEQIKLPVTASQPHPRTTTYGNECCEMLGSFLASNSLQPEGHRFKEPVKSENNLDMHITCSSFGAGYLEFHVFSHVM